VAWLVDLRLRGNENIRMLALKIGRASVYRVLEAGQIAVAT
jgi:hypothetical protein